MDNANLAVEGGKVVFRPSLGTGRETVLNHMTRQITMQLKLLGLGLPLKRRVAYSEVVRIGSASKSRLGFGAGRRSTLDEFISPGVRTERMGELDFVFDVMATIRGGKTISLGHVRSAKAAADVERELRRVLGLSDTF